MFAVTILIGCAGFYLGKLQIELPPVSYTHLRPKGSPVKNSALTSTGLVPFMERYSNSTREVAQDGRRGALMLSVSIKHPDSEAFIAVSYTHLDVYKRQLYIRI